MSKVINHEQLTETIGLSECTDGFWLYDETREMNLSMRAKTKEQAFIEALTYYQDRLQQVEMQHNTLCQRVDSFVALFVTDEE